MGLQNLLPFGSMEGVEATRSVVNCFRLIISQHAIEVKGNS